MSEFLSPNQARDVYNLESRYFAPRSEIEQALMRAGIAAIEMPLSGDDFQRLSSGMAVCLEECPDLLAQTFHKADSRYGGEAGFVRKEKSLTVIAAYKRPTPKATFISPKTHAAVGENSSHTVPK